MPRAVIIAGPNGAGKSTLSARFVTAGTPFLNADEIARTLPQVPGVEIAAGRLLREQLDAVVEERSNFVLETTLANRALKRQIKRWQQNGYFVSLVFVWITNADLAVQRVAQRVLSGGHNIPEATIRRRYQAGLNAFFTQYQPMVDSWRVYDNSGLEGAVLVASGRIWQRDIWEQIKGGVGDEKDND